MIQYYKEEVLSAVAKSCFLLCQVKIIYYYINYLLFIIILCEDPVVAGVLSYE